MTIVLALCQFSCKKFLNIDAPVGSLVHSTAFLSNDQAISAVAGIYATMASSANFASGGTSSVTCLASLSSDEMIGYSDSAVPFYTSDLNPLIAQIRNLYAGPYKTILTANSVLEGLNSSTSITPSLKLQLLGEARFMRAFAYFYLVNLFGQVPLQLQTDYRSTQLTPQSSIENLYQQIITDLTDAEGLLSETYPSTGRVRTNKTAAQAMLARTFLYLRDWANAEKYASLVIAKAPTYRLVPLADVFLANSAESIWQLEPTAGSNTRDGANFILTTTPTSVSLRDNFALQAFQPGDNRQTSWIGNITASSKKYYFPHKYKVRSSTTVTEYSMVLRLAEQYLIRAEARINQPGKITSGIEDLNSVRARARALPTVAVPNPLPALNLSMQQADALAAVEQERRTELFCEWGHRWLDLKRTGRADAVIKPLKANWQLTDMLYPFPENELRYNPNIKQNPGY